MLYEFHRLQNSKKSGSVHATYLVTGIKHLQTPEAPEPVIDGEGDTPMQSSPYMSSPAQPQQSTEEPMKQRVVTLVREEHLEGNGCIYGLESYPSPWAHYF